MDYFFIADRQACFVGAWRSSASQRASVTSSEGTEHYVGLTDTDFKARFANHKQSFRMEKYSSQTELSKYVWHLKKAKTEYKITWKILGIARAYCNTTKGCNLCTLEKYYIICQPKFATLNKRSELVSSCRHASRVLLNNV